MTLGEYVKEFIYNNRISAKDVREGTTGFNFLDSLDPDKRNQLLQEHSKIWENRSPDQQAKLIADFESIIREKRRRDNGKLKGLDNYDVVKEVANIDGPRALDYIMSYLDEHNKLDLRQELQSKETFVEKVTAASRMIEEGKI